METIFPTNTGTEATNSDKSIEIKTKSAPVVPLKGADVCIKDQISAPSYLHSLKTNEAPPFLKPGKEPQPHLMVGSLVYEDEIVEMIAEAGSDQNGLRKFLGHFLVEKKVTLSYSISEKNFLICLLIETIDYGAQRDLNAYKLSVLITIYLRTHMHFKWYYWQAPAEIWAFFKETMIRHTIEDIPDGKEIFSPGECYDIISHFHTIYITNLPLIHILTFGTHRLKVLWPFTQKK